MSSLLIHPGSGAVLFDLDGTLADTDPLHAKSWQMVVRSNFGLTFTWADYHHACIIEGLSPADFFLRLGADVRSDEIRCAKETIFRHLLRTQLRLAPGAENFLRILTGAEVTVAIVSGGSRGSVDAFVEALWPGTPPTITVSREDTIHHKPHPEPYLLAAAKLDLSPRECIAVEDTSRGVQSAHRAGLHSIMVHSDTGQSALKADLVVASLAELAAVPVSDGGGLTIQRAKAWDR